MHALVRTIIVLGISFFQNKEKIQQQQRKNSLIEEETQEQVQLEHAIEEAREVRQQLDEAGVQVQSLFLEFLYQL